MEMRYGDDYSGRCKQSLHDEMEYFLNNVGTLEDLLEILHDVLHEGEQE